MIFDEFLMKFMRKLHFFLMFFFTFCQFLIEFTM